MCLFRLNYGLIPLAFGGTQYLSQFVFTAFYEVHDTTVTFLHKKSKQNKVNF